MMYSITRLSLTGCRNLDPSGLTRRFPFPFRLSGLTPTTCPSYETHRPKCLSDTGNYLVVQDFIERKPNPHSPHTKFDESKEPALSESRPLLARQEPQESREIPLAPQPSREVPSAAKKFPGARKCLPVYIFNLQNNANLFQLASRQPINLFFFRPELIRLFGINTSIQFCTDFSMHSVDSHHGRRLKQK